MESKKELKKRWDNGDLVKTVIDSLKNGNLLTLAINDCQKEIVRKNK